MQRGLERLKLVVRDAARLQPGRPALRMGMRASLALVAPMLVASQLGPLHTTWATLGGFAVLLVDKGGAYRTRAKAMLAATLGGAIGVLAGSLAQGSTAVLVVTAVGTGLCAMAATWPGPAVAVGNIIAWQLIVATTFPHDPARPWLPALAYVAGGAWSMVLALLLWPVRVYRPARLAAARCLQLVAQQAAAIAARDAGDPASWRGMFARRHRAMRETLEAARAVLAATRRGRRGEIGRGERLLVIVESVDQIFGVLIAVEEVVDNLSAEAAGAVAGELAAGLTAAAARLDEIAGRVVVESELLPLPASTWTAGGEVAGLSALALAEVDHARSLIVRIHGDVAALAAVVDSLSDESDPVLAVPMAKISTSQAIPVNASGSFRVPAPPGVLDALRSSLSRDSFVFRHATRVAVVALASVIVTSALDLKRGYYSTLSAVLLLQPYLPATMTRGVQRVIGTIIGCMLAALIAAVIHEPWGIGLAAILLAGVSAAVIQLNYGLYALFLTPTFVLLAEVHAHDTHLIALRIENTLLGAGLAVAGALLLWPARESSRTADRLALAIEAAAGYAREVFAAVALRMPAPATRVISARRRNGRALNNADLSLDRMAAEGPPPAVLESHMTLATMTRRLSATLSALATARHLLATGESMDGVAAIGQATEGYLRELATALRSGTPPPVYRRHEAAPLPALLAARVARIDRQLAILSEAVGRAVTSAPATA